MKNETTRTKTLSGFSSRAIALVLCFVMLLTAIGSGSVLSAIAADFEGNGADVLVDAAKAGADVDAPAAGEAEESSDILAPEDIDDGFVLTKKGDAYIADTGRDADLAETGYSTLNVYTSASNGGTYSYKTNFSGNSGSFTLTLTANEDIYFYLQGDNGNDYYGGDFTLPYNSAFNMDKYYNSVSNVKKIHFQATNGGGTYTFTVTDVTASPTITATGGDGSGSGGSGGDSSIGTKVTDDSLLKILNGTDVSFYIESYTDKEWTDLCNSSKDTPTYTRYGKIGTRWGKSYVQIAKTDRTSYCICCWVNYKYQCYLYKHRYDVNKYHV